MQYFVTLEDTKELRWQAELLFESIKLLGLEDQFVVAICPGKGSLNRHPYPTIVNFENIGRKLGFPYLNHCYGLAKAIEAGVLRLPFTVLHTDMFLISELSEPDSSVVSHNNFDWDTVKFDLLEEISSDDWVNGGNVYTFADVPMRVFESIIKHTYDLYVKYGNKKKFLTYGFNMAIAKHMKPSYKNLEMPLYNDGTAPWGNPVVHYSAGFPPYFIKERVYESIEFSFSLPLPFKAILECPISNQPNVSMMQTLIRSWLDSNHSRISTLT